MDAVSPSVDPSPLAHPGDRLSSVSCVAGTAEPAPQVHSAALLQGRSVVHIEHNGALYQLRSTRLGKLILTK